MPDPTEGAEPAETVRPLRPPPAVIEPAAGTVLGRWQLVRELGRGGMGAVFEAHDAAGVPAAIKVLLPRYSGDSAALLRLDREARSLRAIDHPNVVRCIDAAVAPGTPVPFVALELVRGTDLQRLLIERRRLPLGEALALIREITSGLTAAHRAGVVHRDLKPGNVLVGDDGAVKLADFGLARRDVESIPLTLSGAAMGTPRFMAPEQIHGRAIDARTDVYAVGCLIHQLATGDPPFLGGSLQEIFRQHEQAPRPRLGDRVPDAPDALSDLVARCLAVAPEDRPADGAAVLTALDAIGPPTAKSPERGAGRTAPAPRFDPAAGGTEPNAGSPEPAPGAEIGPYRLIEEIGRGGMGVVYRAEHPALRRMVALKILLAGDQAPEEAVARFLREARAVAKLGHHPHIVPVHDVGSAGRLRYLAMHFVEGRPLDGLIAAGEVTPRRAAALARKIALGLQHAHDHGLLHRDVKPHNVLVTREGEPQITDFGLAKELAGDAEPADGVKTVEGALVGSPSYMPPEQAGEDGAEVDARSDVYGVGATLYHMLTGEPPFRGDSLINVIKKVLSDPPDPPRKRNPAVDRDLDSICLKCLEKERERRYESAGALADDLARWLDGRPVVAKPVGLGRRLGLWARRNRAFATAGLVAAVAVVALGGLATWSFWLRDRWEAQRVAEEAAAEAARVARVEAQVLEAWSGALAEIDARIDAGEPAELASLIDSLGSSSQPSDAARARLAPELHDAPPLARRVAELDPLPRIARIHIRLAADAPLATAAHHWSLALSHDPRGRSGARARLWLARHALAVARPEDAEALARAAAAADLGDEGLDADAAVLLGRALLDQGRWEEAAHRLARAGWPEDPILGDGERLRSSLEALGSVRDDVRLPALVGTWEADQITPLDTPDGLVLVLATRAGWPAFASRDGALVPVSPSPLEGVLEPSDHPGPIASGDLDGDGEDEVIVTLFRQGAGGGYIICEREDGGRLVPTVTRLENVARPDGLTLHDVDGDGGLDAVITFHFQAREHWVVRDGGRRLDRFRPNVGDGDRAWARAPLAGDLDGDGSVELLLVGGPTANAGVADVFRFDEQGQLQLSKPIGRELLGSTVAVVPLGSGLLAAATSCDESDPSVTRQLDRVGSVIGRPVTATDRADGVTFFRATRDGLELVHKAVLGDGPPYPDVSRNLEIRPAAGLVGDRRALVVASFDGEGRRGDRAWAESGRLWLLDPAAPTAPPLDLGNPSAGRRVRSLLLTDLDGDGENELVVLGFTFLVVRDRLDQVTADGGEGSSPIAATASTSEATAILQALHDILTLESVLDLEPPEPAADPLAALHERLGERFRDAPEVHEAARLRVLAGLERATRLRARSARHHHDGALAASGAAEDRADEARAEHAEAERLEARAHDVLHDAEGLARRTLAELARTSASLASLSAPTAAESELRRLVGELGLARRDVEWRPSRRLERPVESGPRTEGIPRIGERALGQLEMGPAIIRAEPGLGRHPQLVADLPSRVRRTASDGLAVAFDAHSSLHVIGVPVDYGGGRFVFEVDLAIDWSAWRGVAHVGLIPRDTAWPTTTEPFSRGGPRSVYGVRWPSTVRVDTVPALGGTRLRLPGKADFTSGGNGWGQLGRFPGRWSLRLVFLAGAGKAWLEVREGDRVIHRASSTVTRPPAGSYVAGIAIGYEEAEMQSTHENWGSRATIELDRLALWCKTFRAATGRAPTSPREVAHRASREELAGRPDVALERYRDALALDPTDHRIRVSLALLTGDPADLAPGFRSDPYGMVLAVDDAARGADLEHVRRLGRLLQAIRAVHPEADALLGDDAAALARLGDRTDHAAHYLRARMRRAGARESRRALTVGGLRLPGLEMPDVIWAPTPEDPGPTRADARPLVERALAAPKEVGPRRDAWVALSRMILADRDVRWALNERAKVSWRRGRPARAFQDWRRMVALAPGDPAGWIFLAQRLAMGPLCIAGWRDLALDLLDRAVEAGATKAAIDGAPELRRLQSRPRFEAIRARAR